MHCHSMRNGPREWRRNGGGSGLASCAFGAFRFLGAVRFFRPDIDTNSPAITNKARASQVSLLSIIPLRSRMQRKIQRAGFRVRAQLLH